MEVKWFGHSFFQITTKENKEKVSILIDPFSKDIGLSFPKVEADILLLSHNHFDHNNERDVKGNYFLIKEPGEYEIKKVFVQAIKSFHDDKEGKERGENLIFKILSEDISLCHLGDLGQKELTKEQLEELRKIDILMIPVGGIYTISGKEAKNIVDSLKPKIVIPMHYGLPKLKIKLQKVDEFLKLMGGKKEEGEILKIKKSDLEKIKNSQIFVFKL